MNPLDLKGPEFLLFYLVYGATLFAVVLWLSKRIDDAGASQGGGGRWVPGRYPGEEDAYPIALLRGGRREVARTVLARLVASGKLRLEGGAVLPGTAGEALSGIEGAAMTAVHQGRPVQDALAVIEQETAFHVAPIEEELRREGLLTSHETRRQLRRLCLAALLVLPGLGVVKLMVALSRGRTNVGFLLLLILLYSVLLLITLQPPAIRPEGKRYLEWVEDACRGLGSRLRTLDPVAPASAGEMALAAGIFGLAVVPGMTDLDRRHRGQDAGSGCGGGDGGGGDGGGGGCGGGGGSGCGGGGGCGGSGCGGCGGH